MAKKCPPGKYYCFTDKKCKKIPRGYYIGARGYLARGDNRSDSGNGNGNGSSNGNGNGGNGSGNGNGGSGGNGGGNGGGGMGESIIYEKSNPRIPRKKGQPAKSKKHSDLYTDEDPKGTIHGLGFKDVAKARASVSKIRNSSRSHAHKIQAAVAMEQRAREMGKTSEAAVYRKYINAMKKKTKRMNEAVSAAQQAAIAIDMKKKGKKPKSMKEGMYNHTDVGLITNAVVELEDGLKTLKTITYDSVDQLMQGIAKRNDISPTLLHNQFKAKHFTIPDNWAIRYRMNKRKGIEEAKKMTKKQMKKRDEIADAISTREMNQRYGDKNVKYAIATKLAMKEEETDKYNVSEEGLRDWFGKSSGTTKSGRKVRGWVQVGGKYDGKPCARQPGQKSTPKCVSSSKRRSMSKSERDSAARRKRAADPNQPQKSGAAKPTNVSTDPKRKMKENYFNRNKVVEGFKGYADLSHMQTPKQKKEAEERLKKFTANTYREMKKKDKIKIGESKNPRKNKNDRRKEDLAIERQLGLPKRTDGSHLPQQFRSESKQHIDEAKDKKGKGSGTKDACYHKVKSRYSVWPSAYASGALVKCRKVGAANWGNKTKKEGFSPMQVAALEAAGMIELNEAGKKCWKGYKKAGTQKLFGKTYNRCVKAGDELNHDGEQLQEMNLSYNIKGGEASKQMTSDALKSVRKNQKNEKIRNLANNPGTKGEESAALAKKKQQAELPKFESYAPVTEGVMALMRKKEEKKKSKPSVSKYVSKSKSDAGNRAAKIMRDKEQRKYVGFLPANEEKDLTNESKTRLVKNGHTYKVVLTWRGKTYMVQMFVPSVSRPTRQQVEKEVQKIYPDAKLMSFLPRDLEPGEPTVMMGEEKRDEYGDIVGGPKISKKQKAKNLAKNEKDEQHTTTTSESYSSKPSNLKKKAKLTAALNRLQDLKVKQKITRSEECIYIGEIKLPLRSASKRLPGGAPNKELGLDFDLSGVPDKRPTKEPEKRPYTKMSHDERVKDNKRIQAAKDAADPDKKERQRKYQENLRKNPAVIARKKAIKDGRYPKYGNDISFADQGQKIKDVEASRKKGYHVNTPREVYDDDPIPPKPKQEKRVDSQNKISGFDSGKQGGGVRRRVPNKPNTGGAEITGSRNMSLVSNSFRIDGENISEDDMKGMSVKSGHKRPTKAGAGMTKKGVEAYRRRNPGSKLKTAVTTKPSKLKKGSKAANRRKSYCARSAGQMKKFPKAAKDPNSRLRQARRRWNC